MAELPAQPSGPPESPAPTPPPDGERDFLDPAIPASDDQPTVISRKKPTQVPVHEALADVLRGRKLAHYELLEPIGIGGMAAVIRARDLQLDRTVALKILPPEMAADSENVLRFHQEARAAARLDHENIARVFFCGEDQGLHFIAFEFVEGENLRSLLEHRKLIPVGEALHYVLQIATGLAHAAERGVVHRDIKPSNIVISPDGRAKLVDMGLARSLHADNGLTQSGVTLGTFDYISPEQAIEPREVDIRSDIYSLGCTAYHMLTSQPPVPEGTAAKKLHHHQHVAPLDPRLLNAAIPDDVAALLARMMAKDAGARYQKPEKLIEHLILLAQKYGTTDSTDGPDGNRSPLFIDALWPAPPTRRPWLIAAVAVAALVALVFLLSPPQPGGWTGRRESLTAARADALKPRQEADFAKRPEDGRRSTDEASVPASPSPRPVVVASREPVPVSPRDGRELADFLPKHERSVVTLEHDLELKRDEQLAFEGEELILQAAAGKRPTIRLKYDGSRLGEPWAALTVRGGNVKLIGLRFEIDASESSELVMAAVALSGGRLTIERCEFVQVLVPDTGSGSLSSVSVTAPANEAAKPILLLNECLFVRGQRGVTLTGGCTVKPTSCAFGPHTAAAFQVQGANRDAAEIRLANCSLLLTEGPALRLQEGAFCHLTASHNILSRLQSDATAAVGASLLQLTGDGTGTIRYTGQRNCFHNLSAYCVRTQDPQRAITKWSDFRRQLGGAVQDDRSIELTASPWADPDPLAALARKDYRRAFEANTLLPALRWPDDANHMLGVEVCSWGPSYEVPLPVLEERRPAEVAARKDKVVDPTVAESGDGVYPTIGQALGEARPGDVILIKHTGRLPVEPVRLEKPTVDLTIKAFPGCRPVLTLGSTTEIDVALFRLHDGQLRLEGLDFSLQPRRADFKGQTVLALVGDGQCVFKDCVATLEETREVPVALVTLTDPGSVVRMGGTPPPRQPGARIRVEGCFVRGGGDLVAVRPSRPFELRVEDTLLALDGSILYVEGAAKEPPAHAIAQVSLKKVTAYLADHAFLLRACREEGKPARGLSQTQMVSVLDCLFASSGGKSLVHLDGVDTEDQMRRLISWGEGRHNAYCNFAQLMDQQPREADMSLLPFDRQRWEDFTRELDGRFGKAKFASPPGEGALPRVLPGDFRIKAESDLNGYGADLDRLPTPAAEDRGVAMPSE
jgi:serine/threonine protein kinase